MGQKPIVLAGHLCSFIEPELSSRWSLHHVHRERRGIPSHIPGLVLFPNSQEQPIPNIAQTGHNHPLLIDLLVQSPNP